MPTTGGSIGSLAGFATVAGNGNGADMTDDALWTFTMPANGLIQQTDSLVIDLLFQTAANANNKNAGINIGGRQVNFATVFTFNNLMLYVRIMITYLSATALNIGLAGISNSGAIAGGGVNYTVPSMATNATIITITGSSPTTGAANDIRLFSGAATYIK